MNRCLIVLAGLLAACTPLVAPDSGSPTGTDTQGGGPIIAPIDPSYVPLVPGDTSFWAVKGRELDVVLRFHSGTEPGDPLVEFHLGAESLLRTPAGEPIADGDSVLITVHTNAQRMSFEFDPSGLVFDASAPALLRMWCTHAAADLNGDGVVNGTDERLWYQLGIWSRETTSDPWAPLATTRSSDGEEMETSIPGFTGFSVAS